MYNFTNNDLLKYKENKYLVVDNFLDTNIGLICQKEILFKTSNLRTGNIYCWKKL